MTTETPADQLRAAASLLREAAGHATPGPWRTHDTHLGGTGGHTATVLTDRPDINDTELIAWLPTMSNAPWDEARNAWRNAGWMALMDPSVGLALADWLDTMARTANDEGAAFLDHALAVTRQVLGTTTGQPETEAPADDRRDRYAAAMALRDGHPEWPVRYEDEEQDYRRRADAAMAVADAEQAALRAEVEGLDEALRGAIAVSEKDGARLRAEMERRTLMLQASRDQVAKLGTTITRLRAERTELSRQLDCSRGDARDMEAHVREQDAEFERLRRLADEAQQPTPAPAETEVTP